MAIRSPWHALKITYPPCRGRRPRRPAGRQYNKRDAPNPSPLGKGDHREAVVEEDYRSPYLRQLFQLIVTASCASGGPFSVFLNLQCKCNRYRK